MALAAPDLAPELTLELRRSYVQRRLVDLRDLEAAMKIHDFETMKQVGHKIRGNAASFSYPDLENLAIKLEEAAIAQDFLRAFEVGREFRKWIVGEMCRPWFRKKTADF